MRSESRSLSARNLNSDAVNVQNVEDRPPDLSSKNSQVSNNSRKSKRHGSKSRGKRSSKCISNQSAAVINVKSNSNMSKQELA